jgi:hypothetical protein
VILAPVRAVPTFDPWGTPGAPRDLLLRPELDGEFSPFASPVVTCANAPRAITLAKPAITPTLLSLFISDPFRSSLRAEIHREPNARVTGSVSSCRRERPLLRASVPRPRRRLAEQARALRMCPGA